MHLPSSNTFFDMVASSNLEEGTPNPTRTQGKSIFVFGKKKCLQKGVWEFFLFYLDLELFAKI